MSRREDGAKIVSRQVPARGSARTLMRLPLAVNEVALEQGEGRPYGLTCLWLALTTL